MMNKMEHTYATILFWICTWFILNLAITILNKSIFAFNSFNFPSVLTTVHMIVSWLGGYICIHYFKLCDSKPLDDRGMWTMFKASVLFTSNIILGNISLRYVSVSFNQIMRATVPGITMILSHILMKETFSRTKKISMVFACIGVMIACYGDIEFTYFGFFITLVAIVAAAMKVVVSSMMIGGEYKLHPIDLLYRMSGFGMFESLFWSCINGEVIELRLAFDDFAPQVFFIVLFTGLIAFALNVASFQVNKVTSALTLTIVANVKQVVVIALAIFAFSTPITVLNSAGVLIVLLASAWYSQICYSETEAKRVATSPESGDRV